jgi:hypothetical protein
VPVAGTLLALVSVPRGLPRRRARPRVRSARSASSGSAPWRRSAVASRSRSFPRLSVRATYAEYHGDFGTEAVAPEHARLGACFWVGVVLSGSTAYVAAVLRGGRA